MSGSTILLALNDIAPGWVLADQLERPAEAVLTALTAKFTRLSCSW